VIYDVAVIIPTTLRPALAKALRSVFAQSGAGSVQILVGVDIARGSADMLEPLRAECPAGMDLHVIDPGFSTARHNGGYYPTYAGGSLRTVLSYLANSRYLAYLDDDNWWAPTHLSDLLQAIDGVDWAYSYRWYVDPATQQPLCIDRWESVGPGRGYYRRRFNGFVDTNCLLLDKDRCHWMLPAWCIPLTDRGEGEDRIVFEKLQSGHSYRCTEKATAYYVFRAADRAVIQRFISRGVAGGAGNDVAASAADAPASTPASQS
jgi:hypothetical protein